MKDTFGRPVTPGRFHSIDRIKRYNAEAGFYYFSTDAVRSFGSRVGTTVYAGRIFVESVQPPHSPRAYQVLCVHDDGRIGHLSEIFRRDGSVLCDTRTKAHRWARNFARKIKADAVNA